MSTYYQTPNQVDAFTRVMAEMYHKNENHMNRNQGFMAFFGNTSEGGKTLFTDDATNVDITIVESDHRISEMGERGVGVGQNQRNRQGYKATVDDRKFPIIKDGGVITAAELYAKQAPELGSAGGSMSREERARYAAMLNYTDIIVGQKWLFESLAAESILTGKMTANKKGDQFDFRRDADNTFTVPTAWDQAGADPMDDISTISRLVDYNGSEDCDFIGMDEESFKHFIRNAEVKSQADNRRYEVVRVGQNGATPDARYNRLMQSGWQARAWMTTDYGNQVWIFTYTRTYKDTNGDRQKYLPKGTVFGASVGGRFDRYIGPHDKDPILLQEKSLTSKYFNIGNGLVKGMELGAGDVFDPRWLNFFAFGSNNADAVELEVQSSVIFAPINASAIAVANGTVTP